MCRRLSLVLINACRAKGRVFLTLSLLVDHFNRVWGVTVIFVFSFFYGYNELSLDTDSKCKKPRWGDKMLSKMYSEKKKMFVSFMLDLSCSFLEVVTLNPI